MADNIREFPGNREGARRRTPRFSIDLVVLFCMFALIVLGLVMIYSTSAYEAGMKFDGDVSYYFRHQLFAVGAGCIAMIATIIIPMELYKRFAWPILIGSAFSLFLVLSSSAYSANGATRWFKIGSVSVQPAEIVKIAIIIYMARYLCQKVDVSSFKGIARSLIVPVIMAGLVMGLTSNLSSAIIIGAIAYIMVYTRSKDYKWFIAGILFFIVVSAIYVLIVMNAEKNGWELDYHADRIRAWLDPFAYSSTIGYQTIQSLYAIGSGGLMGKGIGESVQKLGFIPEAQNDMIFAIICEELGFVGALLVVALFGVLISRCRYIAMRAQDVFGSLVATGVMIHLAIQVILNIAVVTNTIPNTGISLPFISYGGTSIVFLMAEVGMVINVGKSIRVER